MTLTKSLNADKRKQIKIIEEKEKKLIKMEKAIIELEEDNDRLTKQTMKQSRYIAQYHTAIEEKDKIIAHYGKTKDDKYALQ